MSISSSFDIVKSLLTEFQVCDRWQPISHNLGDFEAKFDKPTKVIGGLKDDHLYIEWQYVGTEGKPTTVRGELGKDKKAVLVGGKEMAKADIAATVIGKGEPLKLMAEARLKIELIYEDDKGQKNRIRSDWTIIRFKLA